MIDLPASLLRHVASSERELVLRWWTGLSEPARTELGALYKPKAELCSFALQRDEHGVPLWEQLPIIVDSSLLFEREEPDADWDGDFFEYRLVHPDQFRLPQYEHRAFHIGGCNTEQAVHFTQFAPILSTPRLNILSSSFHPLVLG